MARSAKGRQEELEDGDEENFTGNSSSPHKGMAVKGDESNRGKRVNPRRSKHSETEQRRRSKINERFQTLREIIPQNDQKRDKATFLLEVIEYIQFLQEKLQIYEQSYQGWNQEPTKLTPWRNHHGPAKNTTDASQAMQNGSARENNDDLSPLLPKNGQNPIESDLSTTIQKGRSPSSATEAVPLSMQLQLDMFDPIVSSGMPIQHLQEPVSNADNMPSHKACCAVPYNTSKEQEELTIESGSASISSACSRGILDTLTQVLRSSGVDLSEASISVQIDVGREARTGLTAATSSSKDHENNFMSNQAIACSGVDYGCEHSEHTLKKLRRDAS